MPIQFKQIIENKRAIIFKKCVLLISKLLTQSNLTHIFISTDYAFVNLKQLF